MKVLALQQRNIFNLSSPRVTLSDLRKIYKYYGVQIDLWPLPGMSGARMRELKGAYMHINKQPTALISRNLPDEQRIFTLGHELKHHLVDFESCVGESPCLKNEKNELIEIGAEVFAAELIYPTSDYCNDMKARTIVYGKCTDKDIVRLKRETKTTLSFTSLAKRAMILGYAPRNSLNNVRWKKLEEQMYGEPVYKRINRYRRSYTA